MRHNKAVFLDRDGTINVEKNYLIDPAEFEFLPGAPDALRRLQDAGWLLVVITNQSGVARGYFPLEQVARLHEFMRDQLSGYGVILAGVYVCPHHPVAGSGEYLQDCECRKGKPGLLLQAAGELHIDLSRSVMIGDKLADVEAGLAAGCRSYLVRTGYGTSYVAQASGLGARIVEDLAAAAAELLQEQES